MLLQTLHSADELRPYEELKPRAVQLSDKEMKLALMLIERIHGKFDHSTYHDDYREALLASLSMVGAGK